MWTSGRRAKGLGGGGGRRGAVGGCWRGRRFAECVHSGQCVRVGRRSARSGGTYAGRRRVVGWVRGGESLGCRAGDGAPGREGGPPRRGRRRVGGGNGRRGRLPRLGSGGRERWRRGECPAGQVSCACGRWGTWRRGLLCLTWGPRALCGHGASGSVGGRNGGVIAGGCVWQGGAESRPGRAGGGRAGC